MALADSTKDLSTRYLELERLLQRIANSKTHYEALGIASASAAEQIQEAYRDTEQFLNQFYTQCRDLLPTETKSRIIRAQDKITNSFSVLSQSGTKVEYDNSLRPRQTARVSTVVVTPVTRKPAP